ncbi:MAG: alkaline phosphatase family protein, partial [Planctomycetes bacterium]|nr:alkaline phosphatase family protein [Planctomycetota bacterium]
VALEQELGPFPFSSFWGPRAGLPSSEWIARASARVLRDEKPDLLLVYLPHLDYQPQRTGPSGCDMKTLVGELDRACQPLLEAIDATGAATWVVGEYGHTDASQPIYINQSLRRAGWLETRDGPYGEGLDTFGSRAFAVCDHQVAHVRVRDTADIPSVVEHLSGLDGVAEVLAGADRARVGLDHPRSGEVIAFSRANAWFAYPYWLESKRAPDFARTVDIHRKPGYDPCELFVDPAITFPMVKVARKLMARKLGFRALIDVIPLDASLVKGSHGLRATTDADRPVLIGSGPAPADEAVDATAVLPMLLGHWGLGK